MGRDELGERVVGPHPFGAGPPWMIAYNLDRMGWLPRSRILNFGADGGMRATVTVAALSHPTSPGALLVRIPFDIEDPMHYYTVEFRRKDSWDAGIPSDAVLIHEVRKHFDPSGIYQGRQIEIELDRLSGVLRERGRSEALAPPLKAPVPLIRGYTLKIERADIARVPIVVEELAPERAVAVRPLVDRPVTERPTPPPRQPKQLPKPPGE